MADWTSEDFGARLLAGQGAGRAPRAAPGPQSGRPARQPPLAALLAMAAALGVVLLVGHRAFPPRGNEATAEAPAQVEAPSWSPILRPVPGFVFETPLVPRELVTLTARRHHPGGGREDIFALGQPGGSQGFGRVVAYRTGSEAGAPGTLYLELARRVATDGFAVLRSLQPGPVATKFGLVETADVVISGGGGEHRCTAWRIVAEEQDLRVTGWFCPPQDKPLSGPALACLVDRLELAPAQTDAGLKALFAQAERRRMPGCPAARPSSAGRRPA